MNIPGLRPHHERAIDALLDYFDDRSIIAIILGGSVAKGTAKDSSDIDAMVVVGDERYRELAESGRAVEGIFGHCDYEGGYFDVKYCTRDYLMRAAEEGSEPTRNSFVKAIVLRSSDPEIASFVARIGRYPVHEKRRRLESFHAAYRLNADYFFPESFKRENRFLRMRAATEVVLFGLRMILAHNEVLYPCQKWLMRTVLGCADRPAEIEAVTETFLNRLDGTSLTAFRELVDLYAPHIDPDLGYAPIVSRFVADFEQWWYEPQPNIAEW